MHKRQRYICLIMFRCMCMFLCAHSRSVEVCQGGQKRKLKSLELEVQATVNLPTWVPGNELKFWKSGKHS